MKGRALFDGTFECIANGRKFGVTVPEGCVGLDPVPSIANHPIADLPKPFGPIADLRSWMAANTLSNRCSIPFVVAEGQRLRLELVHGDSDPVVYRARDGIAALAGQQWPEAIG